jgi:AcrR family transcriptional regulator
MSPSAARRDERKGAAAEAPPPRRRRSQEERSTETREGLVRAAIECLCDFGYRDATTSVIAARAGVSRGALQHHFASRADLVIAVIDSVATELNFRFDLAALAETPLPARVAAVIEHYWQVFDSRMFRAALNVWLAVPGDPVLARRLAARLGDLQEQIVGSWHGLFAELGRSDAELSAVRRTVMAAVRGYAIARVFGPAEHWSEDRAVLCDMTLTALRRAKRRSRNLSPPERAGAGKAHHRLKRRNADV